MDSSKRLYQDYSFEITHLRGCAIEALVGHVDPTDLHLYVILMKPTGRRWQRFFLDLGAGFWEEWSDEAVAEELADPDEIFVDYAEQFGLRGAEIVEIRCQPLGEDLSSEITIRLSCGALKLTPKDPDDLDTHAVLSFHA